MNTIHRLFTYAVAATLGLSLTASAATHTREIDREFSASQFEKLDVRIPSGVINAVVGNDSAIRIEIDLETKVGDASKANELFDKSEVQFIENDRVLSVVIKKTSRKGFFSIFRRNRDQVIANVNVIVPRDLDVRLDLGSGRVEADGLVGNIVLDTGSGSINAKNLIGMIVADTGSGNIMLDNIEGNLTADTGSGNIDISGLNGELNADTGSGRVSASGNIHLFNVDTGSGSIDIHSHAILKDRSTADTGSGGIRVELPQSSGFNLDAGNGSGHIDCGFPLSNILQKRNSLKGAANNGGPSVRLRTGSGGISVQPNT